MTRMPCPQELIREIVSYFRPSTDILIAHDPLCSSTLAACSAVSKVFLCEARPILYSRIDMVDWVSQQQALVPHPASQLAAALRLNPNLTKLLKTFTWTIIPPSRDTGVNQPEYDSPVMSSLLRTLVGVKELKFQAERKEDSSVVLWHRISDDLRASIAHFLTENKEHITTLRFHRFTVPPSLYLQLSKLESLSFFANPGCFEDSKEPIRFSGPSIAKLRCMNASAILAAMVRGHPQALEAATSVTVSIDSNALRGQRFGLEDLLVGTQKSLSSLKLYLSYGGEGTLFLTFLSINSCPDHALEVFLNFGVPHMRQLTDLEIHWELDEIFPGIDTPPVLSGFFTLVLPLLQSLLKHDTLVNISIHVNRRCADIGSPGNAAERVALHTIFDATFARNRTTMTKLRNVSLTVTNICPRGQCDKCADCLMPPISLSFLTSQKQLNLRFVELRASAQRRFSEFRW